MLFRSSSSKIREGLSFRHTLKDKPSLILELDEHSGVAGLLTRIEAYRNVVKNLQQRDAAAGEVSCLRAEALCR